MKAGLSFWLFRVLLILLSIYTGVAAASDQLTLGIHPYKSPTKLLKAYTPLAEYLTEKVGVPVQITISKDYQTHIDSIGSNRLDIAYMGPASYIKLVDHYGKKPILACQAVHGKPTFQGKIITRKESTLNSLGQMKGKAFAFGDPNSTMSHLVPRYMLWKAGISADELGRYKFLGSHDNVALAVLAGDYDAGAVKESVFYKYEERGLKAIADTPALYEHIFVTSNKLDPATIQKLRDAFLTLDKDSNGSMIMNSIKPGITSMYPARDKDYDELREILRTLKQIGVIE